jgi:hypothetical protein
MQQRCKYIKAIEKPMTTKRKTRMLLDDVLKLILLDDVIEEVER